MRYMDVILGLRTTLAVLITLSGIAAAEESTPIPVPQLESSAPKVSRPTRSVNKETVLPEIQPVSQVQTAPLAPPVLSHPSESGTTYNQDSYSYPPTSGSPVYHQASCPSCQNGHCENCEECDNGKCYGWVNGCQNCEEEAWSAKYYKRRWAGITKFDKWFRQPWIKSHCIQPADCCESAKWYKYP